jgi:hypothetical protein
MTRDQMLKERDRLQGVLEAYQVSDPRGAVDPEQSTEGPDPDRHIGLKRRIADLARKLEASIGTI